MAYHFSGGEKEDVASGDLYLVVFLSFPFSLCNGPKLEQRQNGFKISSSAFENSGQIPKKYTCDGVNVNPSLKIENVPSNTKSLALVFDDMDAPRGTYVHWILWNINPNIKEIKENSVPEGAVQGMNDFKKPNYGDFALPGGLTSMFLKSMLLILFST